MRSGTPGTPAGGWAGRGVPLRGSGGDARIVYFPCISNPAASMRLSVFPALMLFVAAPLAAQLRPVTCCNKGPVIVYDISFPSAAHHEAVVSATFTALPPGPVNIRMARSSTGRYALTEYAKNVCSVTAVSGAGKSLPVVHVDPYSWTVSGHDGTVTLRYMVFANVGNGTFSGFNADQRAHSAAGHVCLREVAQARPIRVTFHRPDPSWTIATQLVPTRNPETLPLRGCSISSTRPRTSATSSGANGPRRMTAGSRPGASRSTTRPGAKAIDAYADGAKKIVHEAGAVYGEFPKLRLRDIHLRRLLSVRLQGDGMEHRNSTSVTGGSMDGDGARGSGHALARILPLVEREADPAPGPRAVGLRPRQHDRRALDRRRIHAVLRSAAGRARRRHPRSQRHSRSRWTINAVANNPGRLYFGPIGMSQQAPFRDGAAAADAPNPNTFISYYTYGAALATASISRFAPRGSRSTTSCGPCGSTTASPRSRTRCMTRGTR